MATTGAKFMYLAPADVADDNMEISSEFGGGETEDIDIDLDIPNYHHDEDHSIEDAKLETEFDRGFEDTYETHQADGNDDFMVDGENPSFPMNDFDAPDVEIKDLDTDDSNDSEMIPLIQEDEQLNKFEGVDAAGYVDAADASEQNWDNNHFLNTSDENGEEAEAIPEVFVSNEPAETKEDQQAITSPPQASVNPKSPPENADSHSAGTPEPESNETANGTYSAVAVLASAQIDSKETILDSSEDQFLESQGVIVVYQDTEYALIAMSEDENPNSFFLKDDSLTYAPLSTFFTAIREVLGDDVTSDDELCLSVGDLCLEFTETCRGVDIITFKQVIDLRGRLLINDGVQPSGPIFVTLTIKPEFSKKFAALSAGATEGKGLSELVSWDEIARDVDDDKNSRQDDGNVAWAIKNEHENASENHAINDSPAVPEQEILSEESLGNEDGILETELQQGQEIAENFEDVSAHPGASENVEAAPESKEKAAGGDDRSGKRERSPSNQSLEDLDEDGDLIDYEEEEFEQEQRQISGNDPQNGTSTDFISSCVNSYQACFCLDCTEVLRGEYEIVNENLRQRTISDSVERRNNSFLEMRAHGLPLFETNFADLVTHQTASESPEAKDGNEESDQYDQSANEHVETQELQTQEQADSSVLGNGEHHTSELRLEIVEQQISTADDENFDEIGYDTQVKSDVLPVDEIGYDEAPEGAESNESDHTLVEDDQIEALDEAGDELDYDEINYEDDDHQPEVSKDYGEIVEATPAQSGKRPREDTEEFLDTDSKGSKRARS